MFTRPAKKNAAEYHKAVVSSHVVSFQEPKQMDQFHRYGRHQAACREQAGSYDKTTWTAICFEHKTQYLLIRAPYTRNVVFWHTVGCYNSWANLRCSGCYPLGEKLLWNRSIGECTLPGVVILTQIWPRIIGLYHHVTSTYSFTCRLYAITYW